MVRELALPLQVDRTHPDRVSPLPAASDPDEFAGVRPGQEDASAQGRPGQSVQVRLIHR